MGRTRLLSAGLWLAALALLWGTASSAEAQRQPKRQGIESADYVWNAPEGVKVDALARQGDLYEGLKIYKDVCIACHLEHGGGLTDGTYPQLAGQHKTVIVKQLADIAEGRRDSAIMYRFAREFTDAQKLADVALYIEFLKIRRHNGKGPGFDLEHGEELYTRDCVRCHGVQGEGIAEEFYPVVAGQHFEYVLRQLEYTGSGRRRNTHPEMVTAVERYSARDYMAVADYVSRLLWPERSSDEK